LELPGRDKSLFSPTLREPSLIALELDVNGSGAASFEVFASHFLQTIARVPDGVMW